MRSRLVATLAIGLSPVMMAWAQDKGAVQETLTEEVEIIVNPSGETPLPARKTAVHKETLKEESRIIVNKPGDAPPVRKRSTQQKTESPTVIHSTVEVIDRNAGDKRSSALPPAPVAEDAGPPLAPGAGCPQTATFTFTRPVNGQVVKGPPDRLGMVTMGYELSVDVTCGTGGETGCDFCVRIELKTTGGGIVKSITSLESLDRGLSGNYHFTGTWPVVPGDFILRLSTTEDCGANSPTLESSSIQIKVVAETHPGSS